MKIIIDSTADYTQAEAKKLKIDVLPLKVMFGNKEYKDRVDLSAEEFYEMLVSSDVFPTTSQVNSSEFLPVLEEAKENGESVVMILLDSKISGTYQSAVMAKEMCDYDDIYVVDSLNASGGYRILVEKAIELRDQGVDAKTIAEVLNKLRLKVHTYAIVDTLEYLQKGGRISKTTEAVGTLLKFKPVIGFDDGVLQTFSKARGFTKATKELIKLVHQSGGVDLNEKMYITYTTDLEGAKKFNSIIDEEFSTGELEKHVLGPVIGAHFGPGGFVFSYVHKE